VEARELFSADCSAKVSGGFFRSLLSDAARKMPEIN
jgi:hypothetical protein